MLLAPHNSTASAVSEQPQTAAAASNAPRPSPAATRAQPSAPWRIRALLSLIFSAFSTSPPRVKERGFGRLSTSGSSSPDGADPRGQLPASRGLGGRAEASRSSGISLRFASADLEQRFSDFLARTTFVHSLLMHAFYATGVNLAFVLRNVNEPPAAALGRWDCAAQLEAGALRPSFPCDGSPAQQARHVVANFPFYFLARPAILCDWGCVFNFVAMALVAAWLLLLAATGARHRPSGPAWRLWLRWRVQALSVTPLYSWCLAVPTTVLAAGPDRWWQLGSYNLLHGAVRQPGWDAAVFALLTGGLRQVRFAQLAPVCLVRAAVASLVGAYVDVRDAAAMVAAATVSSSIGGAADVNATEFEGALAGSSTNGGGQAAAPLAAAWAAAACRHLAAMVPLACLPLAWWWWSERSMRAAFLALEEAAAASTAATTPEPGKALASSGKAGSSKLEGGAGAFAAAAASFAPAAVATNAAALASGPGGSRQASRLTRGSTGSRGLPATASSFQAAASSVPPFPSIASSGALCSQAPDAGLSCLLSTADSSLSALSSGRSGIGLGRAGSISGPADVSGSPPAAVMLASAASATSWWDEAAAGAVATPTATSASQRSSFGPAQTAIEEDEEPLAPLARRPSVLAQPIMRGTLYARPLVAAAPAGPVGSATQLRGRPPGLVAGGGGCLPPSMRYQGLTCMQAISVRRPTGTHEAYADRLAAAVTPLIFPPPSAPTEAPAASIQYPGPAYTAAPSPPFAARTGGFVVVEGCVQLIAWVRGVDGSVSQRLLELDSQLAAALGLDESAVASLAAAQAAAGGQPLALQRGAGGPTAPLALPAPAPMSAAPALALAVPALPPPPAVSAPAAPLLPPFPGLHQALAGTLPDASRVGPWAVQGPQGEVAEYNNHIALPPQLPCSTSPYDVLHGSGALPACMQPPPIPQPSGSWPQSSAPASAPPDASSTLADGAPVAIECAWTPCVPTAPADAPPVELELGLTSAVSQTLRLLLVQHGVLLADFTCVLGEGAQVLALPVPSQPSPTVLQLVFAPAAGAATPSSPLLYDIATLLAVPPEVASELAVLSQVMRMEYGGAAAHAAAASGAAWRDHYAPLISDLAFLMERAELAAAAEAASRNGGSASGELATLVAAAAADGPSAVLRVAQQLMGYLEANGMPGSGRFVAETAHAALRLHASAGGASLPASPQRALDGGSAAPPPLRLTAPPAGFRAERLLQAPAAGTGSDSPRLAAQRAAARAAAAVESPRAPVPSTSARSSLEFARPAQQQQQQPQQQATPSAASGRATPKLFSPFASSTEPWPDADENDDLGAGPSGAQQDAPRSAAPPAGGAEGHTPLKLPLGLPSPFSAAAAPWGDSDSQSEVEDTAAAAAGSSCASAERQQEPEIKLPPGIPSPFSAAMAPWPEDDEAEPEAPSPVPQPAQEEEPVIKLPAGLPSPFSAAMQPWPEDDEDEQGPEQEPEIKLPEGLPSPFSAAMQPWPEAEDEEAAQPEAGGNGSGSPAGAEPEIKLPAGLPSPFSAAMQAWAEEEEVEPEPKPSASGSRPDPEPELKLPAGLPSPFAAAMQPWPEEEEDGAESPHAPPAVAEAQEPEIKLPAGLPSPFSAAMQPWPSSSEDDGAAEAPPAEPPPAPATAAASTSASGHEPIIKLPAGLPSPFAAAMAPWPEEDPPEQAASAGSGAGAEDLNFPGGSAATGTPHASPFALAGLMPFQDSSGSAGTDGDGIPRGRRRFRSAAKRRGAADDVGSGGGGKAARHHRLDPEPISSCSSDRVSAAAPTASNGTNTSPFSGRTTAAAELVYESSPVPSSSARLGTRLASTLAGRTSKFHCGDSEDPVPSHVIALRHSEDAGGAAASARQLSRPVRRPTARSSSSELPPYCSAAATASCSTPERGPSTAASGALAQAAAQATAAKLTSKASLGYGLTPDTPARVAGFFAQPSVADSGCLASGKSDTPASPSCGLHGSPAPPGLGLMPPYRCSGSGGGAGGGQAVVGYGGVMPVAGQPGGGLALLTRRRIITALRDSCLGYTDPSPPVAPTSPTQAPAAVPAPATLTSGPDAHPSAPALRQRRLGSASAVARQLFRVGRGAASARPSREASFGVYHSRQALALDGYALVCVAAKTVVCMVLPYILYGTLDRKELLQLVGPHFFLRLLSFAPKAVLLLLAAYSSILASLGLAPAPPPSTPSTAVAAPGLNGRAAALRARAVRAQQWAVAWREAWVLGCGYAELLLLMLPMALGVWAPPGSLVQRLNGLGFEVLMDGVQRNAFDQVRTRRRLPQHTLHCVLLYALVAFQLGLPHAFARVFLIWLSGFVTCLIVEIPRRVDFAVLHSGDTPPPLAAPPQLQLQLQQQPGLRHAAGEALGLGGRTAGGHADGGHAQVVAGARGGGLVGDGEG
ncbi:hypothetical protein HYH03_008158 [Edaphochlamys debaryana]|uniref:Uncharacterized protein n=1 Tax=Edaphochlamys debaryana TaxID=47281 RepID=A0A835Y3V7_9CHLO|nr:hypothetical protein HYH03_008158 [Edaphochlamys debaryana]|eukprot:KAG2493641.1 hypothetical protein HYH03_008158 [Edaphochlamys debaryana]